jgi:heme oxygenase
MPTIFMADIPRISVRRSLAIATAEEHERLHDHPWIASLLEPGLTADRYCLIMSAYLEFFQSLEELRLGMNALAECSLRSNIEALRRDTIGGESYCRPMVQIDLAHVALSRDALLGALYVVHGAGFGARTLLNAVQTALPGAGVSYLSGGTAPQLWRALLAELERLADAPWRQQDLCDSAAETFVSFGRFVTDYCECAHKPLQGGARQRKCADLGRY